MTPRGKSQSNPQPAIPQVVPPATFSQSPPEQTPKQIEPPGRIQRWRQKWQNLSRRRKIITLSIVVTLLTLAGIGSAMFMSEDKKAPTPAAVKVKQEPPKLTTLPSPLSGLQVAPELASRPVTAIMIENSLDARPQSGLGEAGVIFEALAEGGISRFIVLFQDTQPQYIGPVRSLRPHYLDFAAPFDSGIAHVGGSPEALAQVRSGMKDLDQFFNAGSYWRVTTRRAPHNVYTSFEKLDALNKSKGYNNSKFASWSRKADQAMPVPTAKSIDLNLSSANFNVHYDYDSATNSYIRFIGGKPHLATNSATDTAGQQLRPKVVLVLVMSGHYNTNGSGQMFVFQDGGVTPGTWAKVDRPSQFVFTDAASAGIKLNAGQTWVTIVGNPGMVVHRP